MAGKMEIESYRRMGELLIRLANGQESIPTDLKDKVKLLRDNGVLVSGYTDIQFEHADPNVLKIMIPESDQLAESLATVNNRAMADESYPFPPGVEVAYWDALNFDTVTKDMSDIQKIQKKREILQFRIGEYTLGNCK